MNNRKFFTCCLSGQDDLLLEFAQILHAQSVRIRAIISSAVTVRRWAGAHQIPCHRTWSDMDWRSETIDYLLSLGNDELIPDKVLQQFFYLSIRLHDALLPGYAGANAASWAILNNETTHGITWHVIDALVNGGDILMQVPVPIAPDETAASLKIKCREQALNSFPELVDSLAGMSCLPVAQDLSKRSFTEVWQKPFNNACVDWRKSAEEIDRLWRATQFGPGQNPFATCKMLVMGASFTVNALHLLTAHSAAEPGVVLETGAGYWTVSTASNDLQITQLSDASGAEIDLHLLAARNGITPGHRLTALSPENQLLLQELSQQYFSSEQYWVTLISRFEPAGAELYPDVLSLKALPRSLYYQCLELTRNPSELPVVLLTAWAIYLQRMENREQIGIWVRAPHSAVPLALNAFFSSVLPVIIDIDEQNNFLQIFEKIRTSCASLMQLNTFQNDIWQRYPILRRKGCSAKHCGTVDLSPVSHQHVGTGVMVSESFVSLFTQLLLHTEIPVAKISWLSLKDQQQILLHWNATDQTYPDHKTLHRLFEEQVHRTPDHIAVIDADRHITYQMLNCRINQLTLFLKTCHGIQTDQLVAVCVDRSHLMLVALLGILKAGATCLPLEPTDPAGRIRQIMDDSKATLILCTRATASYLRTAADFTRGGVKLLELDDPDIAAKLLTHPEANPRTRMSSSQLAYVIYPDAGSGSLTGVEIEHRAIVNQISWMNSTYPLKPDDRILQRARTVSDKSIWELFWATGWGATVVLCEPDGQDDLHCLASLMRRESITVVQFSASELQQFAAAIHTGVNQPASLQHIFCIGEVPDPVTVKAIRQMLPTVEIHSLFGSSETAVNGLAWDCTEDTGACIGKPIANLRAYVLDQKLRPMPVGARGDLYMSGIGLVRGYVHRSSLTEQRLIVNPFLNDADRRTGQHLRMVKTGAQARWLENGNLEYSGHPHSALMPKKPDSENC